MPSSRAKGLKGSLACSGLLSLNCSLQEHGIKTNFTGASGLGAFSTRMGWELIIANSCAVGKKIIVNIHLGLWVTCILRDVSACLSLCLPACLSVCLSVCCVPARLFMSVCLPACPCVCLSDCLPARPPACLPVSL